MKKQILISNTRKRIINAFLIKYTETPLDQITVKEIAQYCKISRGTFYLHFFDTDDLLTSIEDEHIQAIKKIIDKYQHFYHSNNVNELIEFFIPLLTYIEENKNMIIILASLHSRPNFKNSLKDLMRSTVKRRVEYTLPTLKNYEMLKADYIIERIVTSHIDIITAWIQMANKDFVKQLSQLLSMIILNSPYLTKRSQF